MFLFYEKLCYCCLYTCILLLCYYTFLITTISTLFERILLQVCDEYLNSYKRQFAFKKHLGCASAIFAVRSTMDYSSLPKILQLHLQPSFCLLILQYVNGALRFNQQQIKTLNVCYNSIFRKIFYV